MGLDNIIYEESPCTDTNVLTLTQDLVGGIMTGENAFRGKVFDSLLSEITSIDSVLYGNEDNYIERATLHALSTKYPMNKKSGTAVRTLLSITV